MDDHSSEYKTRLNPYLGRLFSDWQVGRHSIMQSWFGSTKNGIYDGKHYKTNVKWQHWQEH